MTLNEYQKAAQRTSPDDHDKLLNGVMGLCGEAGELINLMKKHMYQGHEKDWPRVVDEVGDCLWYIAEIASGLSVTLELIAMHNVEKLKRRYPDGFEVSRSVNRP